MSTGLLDKALKSVGGTEEFKRKRDEFGKDLAFINDNRDKLFKDYDEKWIAVYKSKIIAHGKDYDSVLSQLEKNDMPVEQIPIRYLSKHKVFTLYYYR